MKMADQSRYALVVTAAKRARQITQGAESELDCSSNKPVTIALHEIATDKIRKPRTRNDFK